MFFTQSKGVILVAHRDKQVTELTKLILERHGFGGDLYEIEEVNCFYNLLLLLAGGQVALLICGTKLPKKTEEDFEIVQLEEIVKEINAHEQRMMFTFVVYTGSGRGWEAKKMGADGFIESGETVTGEMFITRLSNIVGDRLVANSHINAAMHDLNML